MQASITGLEDLDNRVLFVNASKIGFVCHPMMMPWTQLQAEQSSLPAGPPATATVGCAVYL